MTDHRLWWTYGQEYYPLNDIYFEYEWFLLAKILKDAENVNCMVEQLWAMREGLA